MLWTDRTTSSKAQHDATRRAHSSPHWASGLYFVLLWHFFLFFWRFVLDRFTPLISVFERDWDFMLHSTTRMTLVVFGCVLVCSWQKMIVQNFIALEAFWIFNGELRTRVQLTASTRPWYKIYEPSRVALVLQRKRMAQLSHSVFAEFKYDFNTYLLFGLKLD